MISLLVPTYRKPVSGDPQSVWGDLRVLLTSLDAYSPDVEIIVAWDGPAEPANLPGLSGLRVLERPPGLTTCSEAWNWCADQTDADELVFVGDDTVFLPDTLDTLLADVKTLREHPSDICLGMVGVRSNFAKGAQNIREPNNGTRNGIRFSSENVIVETPMIAPVVAWIDRAVFEDVGRFEPTNWFQDDIFCWDLVQRGYRSFVSRAYVHHIGQRGTGQGKTSDDLLREGLAWAWQHRPDFARAVLGSRS